MILKKKIPRDFYKLFRTQNMDYYMQLLTALYQAMQEAYALTQLTDSECRSMLAETIARVNMVWGDDETEKMGLAFERFRRKIKLLYHRLSGIQQTVCRAV